MGVRDGMVAILDKSYPGQLVRTIGASAAENARSIEKHVLKLYAEGLNRQTEAWRSEIEQFNPSDILELMQLPLPFGNQA